MNEYLCNFDLSAVLRRKALLEERKKALENGKKREQELLRNERTEDTRTQEQVKSSQPSIYSNEQEASVKTDLNAPQENVIQLDF